MIRNPNGVPRVLMVTPYSRPVVGGISTFVEGLSSALRARDIDVRILTQTGGSASGVEPGPASPLRFIRWARRRIADLKPDVVHAHGHWYAVAAAIPRYKHPAPRIIFSLHTEFDTVTSALKERLLNRVLSRADVITCPSPESARRFRERYRPGDRVHVLPPGVRQLRSDPESIATARQTLGVGGSAALLCSVSMMVWPDKVRGIRVLIGALPAVLARFPNLILVVVGDGQHRSLLETRARELGVADSVRFAGIQSDPGPFMAASSLFVHCSFRDIVPQSVLEALSLGIPVLVNDEVAACLPAAASQMGVTRAAGSEAGMAEAAISLLEDPPRRRALGEIGRSFVTARYSWDTVAGQAMELYGLTA